METLFRDARRCIAAGAYTGATLLCRKILMHVGHDKGAPPNLSFVKYIEYLYEHHFIPPDGKGWVDYIRQRGNFANHEIHLSDQAEAEALVTLAEMMLRIVYELPNKVPSTPPTT